MNGYDKRATGLGLVRMSKAVMCLQVNRIDLTLGARAPSPALSASARNVLVTGG